MQNFLLKIKLDALKLLQDEDTLITDSLYKTENDLQVPITDTEGTTALLTTDGTSWVYTNETWEQVDINTDYKITHSLYPFIMSVNNSINNNFINLCNSKFYKEQLTFSINADNSDYIDITGFTENPIFQAGDFIYIHTSTNNYLSCVQSSTETSLTIDGRGLNIRITDKIEPFMCLFLVSFPPDYIDTVLTMMAYDFYQRDSKEKRQEKLGNYTYTNFEPTQYYGDGSYPRYLQDGISYWQVITI